MPQGTVSREIHLVRNLPPTQGILEKNYRMTTRFIYHRPAGPTVPERIVSDK